MPLPKDQAWFAAKTYGWGWGLPRRWQGWVVMVGFLAALIGGTPIARKDVTLFVGYAIVLSFILAAICWWKGETPSWRWGDPE
jgi:hypothetical protein